MEEESQVTAPHHRVKKIVRFLAVFVLVWFLAAYLIVPYAWDRYAVHHPSFDASPRITETGDHHPGDPLNVGLVGSKEQIQSIMKAAKWYPAAALGLRSDLEIAADSVLSRPDDEAPVSSLYLFGRKEDLAFEQPVGDNPRHRHHVRLWKLNRESKIGRDEWIGSAVYDERVGLSRTTGEITHVTSPNVDKERDYMFECLEKTGELASHSVDYGFHKQLEGKNGGGDPWHTDGNLFIGTIAEAVP